MMKSRVLFFVSMLLFCLNLRPALAQEMDAYFPTNPWRTSAPEQQGMDSTILADAVNLLAKQDDYLVHSLLVIRNGYFVTDAYFYPYTSGEPHDLASVTKSVTATLVRIAIQQGYFQGSISLLVI
jgi:CubicO group peptidase (beta-lactamase class C family)